MNDAKLEQKRLMSWKNEQDSKTEEEKNNIYYQNQEPPLETLTSYLDILYQFPTDEAINELIAKLRKMEIPELNTELNRLDVMHNRSNKDYLTKSLENIDTRFMTSLLLLYKNQKDAITYSDDEMATAALYHLEKLKEKDSIHFLEKRIVKRDNIETTFYFYQVIKKVEEDEPETKELMTVAFISKDGKLNLRAYNSFKNEEIIDESDLPEIKNTLINEALNRGNLRTNYIIMKNLYGYYPDLYDY